MLYYLALAVNVVLWDVLPEFVADYLFCYDWCTHLDTWAILTMCKYEQPPTQLRVEDHGDNDVHFVNED